MQTPPGLLNSHGITHSGARGALKYKEEGRKITFEAARAATIITVLNWYSSGGKPFHT